MAVTGGLYNGFTFGTVSSKAYGVYITQEAAYNAPEKDVEVFEIAGRNGSYILDNGRFKNITISYKCGIAENGEVEFENVIRAFRNALSAQAGKYVRLTDDYNPDEYREAAFLGGIDVNMADRRAGEFTVSFDAKPQRFLVSGETAVSVASGGSITNPTLFESHPLLEVRGYGTIGIGGEEIELHNEPLGVIALGGGGSYKNSLTYHFDGSAFNTGDAISIPSYSRQYECNMVKPYGSGQVTTFAQTSISTGCSYRFTIPSLYKCNWIFTVPGFSFYYGTANTRTYTLVGELSYDDRDGSATPSTITMTASVIYDGDGTIRFTAAVTSQFPEDITTKTVASNAPPFTGNSTKLPVEDACYIDLDIGEAYIIEDGTYVSIDNVVEIPAELPVLASGSNTITRDNTITSLKVTPRWWEV